MNGHPGSIPGPSGHHYCVRVYYEDTDAGGVVYHANYLRFAERARTEALRQAGIPHAEMVARHGLMFVVRRVKVEYLRPARVDDWLTVTVEPVSLGGASVVLGQRVLRGAELLATAEVRLACVGVADGRAARLPERWRTAIEGLAHGRAAAAACGVAAGGQAAPDETVGGA